MKKANIVYFITTLAAVVTIASCKQEKEIGDKVYSLYSTNDPLKDNLSYTINVKKKEDGMVILRDKRYGAKQTELRRVSFREKDGNLYELVLISDFDRKIIDTISVLYFSQKDTSFLYTFDTDKYPPVAPIGYLDYKYIIKKFDKNKFQTEKINASDASFSETIVYDDKFNILEFSIKEGNKHYFFK